MDIEELRIAAHIVGKDVSGLTGGFWWVEADQNKKTAYSVFSIITGTNSRDTANKFEKIFLQISCYDLTPTGCESIANGMMEKFDDCESTLTLASYHTIRSKRNSLRGPVKLDDKFGVFITYEIDFQKK